MRRICLAVRTIIAVALAGAIFLANGQETEPPSTQTQRASWVAHVLRKSSSGPPLIGLSFPVQQLPVFMVQSKGALRPLVELRGVFQRPGWRLYLQNKAEARKGRKPEEFVLYAYLNGRISEVSLTARNAEGKTQTEVIYLFAPEAMDLKVASAWDAIMLGFGLASFSYAQTTYGTFAATMGMLSAQYVSPEIWGKLGVYSDLDLTFLTLESSPIEANPQVIEAKLDATYLVRLGSNPKVRWRLVGGMSYLTMSSNGSPFGFADLIAPDFGLRMQYYRNQSSTIIGDLRLGLLEDPTLDANRSLNLTFTWSKLLKSLHRLDLGIEFMSYNFTPEPLTNIGIETYSIKLGYSL